MKWIFAILGLILAGFCNPSFGQMDTAFIAPVYKATPIFDNDCGCFNDTTYSISKDSMQIITYENDSTKYREKKFYENGLLETDIEYLDGKLNGMYKLYYDNGQLRRITKYQQDTLQGEILHYHRNGQLAIKREYENEKLMQVRKYDSLGRQILPAFILQKRVWNIWNQTDLKVYLLYEQTDISQLRALDFMEGVYGSICESSTDKLIFKEGNETIIIKENGVSLYEGKDYKCKKELETKQVEANYDWEKRKSILSKEQTTYQTSFGKLVIDSKRPKCLDTGTNAVKLIQNNGKFLFFKDVSNIRFLEYDLDKDGKKELYIFSYETCMGFLRIYKVTQ